MDGRAKAVDRRWNEVIAGAWNTEYFAREKRLKPLSKYLSGEKSDEPKAQTAPEMVAAMRAWVRHTTVQ
jgi:hypothetical protein